MNRRDFCKLAVLAAPMAAAPGALAGSGPLLDPPPFRVLVDPARRLQEIGGFGASGAFHMAGILQHFFPAGDRARILDLLFSPVHGAGLSVVRNIIPPEDGGQAPVLSRAGVADWSSDADQVWLMRQAAQRGATRFISTAWTPPPWMKTNNSIVGGRLRPDCYAAYAEYLAAYAQGYRRHHGLELYSISPQNEPDVTVKYASCAWNGEEFRRFVGGHLGPLWRRRKIPAAIMLGEDSEWTEAPAVPTLQDAAAREAVGIVASHAYFGDNHVPGVPLAPRTGVFTAARQYGKPVWQTEVSAFNANDPGMDDALYWAQLLHFHLAQDNVSGWLYWWLVSPGRNREALIRLNMAQRSWEANKRLFALGQFSRFLRPGAVRVAATANPAPQIFVSAYAQGRRLFVVAINAQQRAALAEVAVAGTQPVAASAWRTSATEDLAPAPQPSLRPPASGRPARLQTALAPRSVTTVALDLG